MSSKKRGRPPGPSKDDSQLMSDVADVLVANPRMRPTTAMWRVKPDASDALKRRFQVRWKAQGANAFAAAQQRAQDREIALAQTNQQMAKPVMSTFDVAEIGRLVREVIDNPAAQLVRELQNNSATRLVRELQNNPAARLVRELQDNPAARLVRELQNNPAARLTR